MVTTDTVTIALLWPRYAHEITSVTDLVLALDKKRYKVIFIYLSGYGTKENFLGDAGYPVFYLSNIKLLNAFRFSLLSRLARILRENNVDLLHCHGHKSTVYGILGARLSKVPFVIAHVHGLNRSGTFIRKLTNFLLYKKVSRIVAVADSVKEDVLKSNWSLPADKVCVLENSVDFERFANVPLTKIQAKSNLGVIPPNAFVYGAIARFAPSKGHSFLIRAFEKVKKRVPGAHLILLGEGRLRKILEAEAAKTTAFESIHFLGKRTDIPEVLRAMDCFILPSIGSEGMPRVLLEAMAAGVPCVGTNIGGTPEVICDRNVGYVVERRDPTALAEAMMRVANLPKDELAKLVEKAQNRVREVYSHKVVIKRLENIYETEIADCYESDRRQKSDI